MRTATLSGMTERGQAQALQRLLIEERRRRLAAEEAFQRTSIESSARSDALYLASYLTETSGELADLLGLSAPTVRNLILKSDVREMDMVVYRAGFAALGLKSPEREYGRKLARKLLARAKRAKVVEGDLAEAVALAEARLSGR